MNPYFEEALMKPASQELQRTRPARNLFSRAAAALVMLGINFSPVIP